jgi:hypothetical protein
MSAGVSVERAGFRILGDNRRQPEWLHATTGHAHRLLLLCEKPDAARDAAR